VKVLWVSLSVLLLPQVVKAQTADDLIAVRQLSEHVMQVRAATLGSAVALEDHLAVTNCHVLGDATTAYVTRGSLGSRAKLKAGDTGRDLCLLELEHSLSFPTKVERAASLALGDKVYAVGFGAGRLSFGVGVVNALYSYDGGLIVRSDAPFAEGASGGGLFDNEGNLVGI
jgi:serine protease Do